MSRADKIWNFGACLSDAVGWPLGYAFFSFSTILPVFLGHLGASNTLIGCLPGLYSLLVFLPGLLVVRYVNGLPRARGYLFWVAIGERAALLPLVWLTVLWGTTHPAWLVIAMFVCIGSHAAMMGINQPAYWVVIGKCVPALWRGRLFGFAGGIAGLLGFGVDAVLRHLLSGPQGGFPVGYSRGFLLGFLLMTVSVLPLGVVREPAAVPRVDDPHSGHYGRDGLRVWRGDARFRRFLYGQIALTFASLAAPFYVLDAQHRLHAGAGSVAGYTATLVLVTAFGSLGWGAWGDRAGNKIVLLAAAVFTLCASAFAPLAASPTAFYGIFALTALGAAGNNIAGNNIVMEYTASPRDIPLYTVIFNAVTALPRAGAPLLGGLLADRAGGFAPVFAMSAAFAAAGLLLTLRAGEPRHGSLLDIGAAVIPAPPLLGAGGLAASRNEGFP